MDWGGSGDASRYDRAIPLGVNVHMPSWRQNLRRLLPIPLRQFAQRAGIYLGDWMYLDTLRRRGFAPAFIIDIGAYHGDWARFARRIFPATEILMIEGQPELLPRLHTLCAREERLKVASVLLGATDGERVRFDLHETGSSVYPEGGTSKLSLDCELTRLDTVLARSERSSLPIDVLKLDVQGYEVEVLKGAQSALSRTEIAVLEASLLPINHGCPLIHDVFAFMHEAGLQLIDIGGQTRLRTGALWQTDLVYARIGSRWTRAQDT